jgi:hypothetical protein
MKKRKSSDGVQRTISAVTSKRMPVRDTKWMGHLEMVCMWVALLIVFFFHYQMMSNGGALWRDEINTFNMASLKSLGDIFQNLEYDSFPMLWFLVLRGWIFAGFGSGIGLRVLGMLVGISGTLSLVWVCRTLGSRIPLLALALLGFCPTVYLVGGSLRAYGCGMMLMFLTLGFFWKAIQDPSPRRIFLACLLTILGVQCIYYNAILLFAMGMGGVAVGLLNRDFKKIAVAIGIGTITALTLIPYWSVTKRLGSWNMLVKVDFTVSLMKDKFREAVAPAGAYIFWIWLALPVVALAVCIWWWRLKSKRASSLEKDRVVFVFTTFWVAIAGYAVFLKVLSYPTEPWYYLSLLALMAVIVDVAVNLAIEAGFVLRIVRVACVLIIMETTFFNTWDSVHLRYTNIDLLTTALTSLSAKDDLILVNPHYYGVSFAHYYKGDTPWVTIPPLKDYRTHRYDLLKGKMMETNPLASVHAKILKTLQSGNRVWVLGRVRFLQNGELPGEIPPAPSSGWNEGIYSNIWWRQTAYLLQLHANKIEVPSIDDQGPISGYERGQLWVLQGWRPQAAL